MIREEGALRGQKRIFGNSWGSKREEEEEVADNEEEREEDKEGGGRLERTCVMAILQVQPYCQRSAALRSRGVAR